MEETASVESLEQTLMDQSLPLFERYRAMFSLRNIGGKAAVDALAKGFHDSSALFRHEIAYVFGQMQDPHSVDALVEVR
jgi:deoxyhypusine monooxygenase